MLHFLCDKGHTKIRIKGSFHELLCDITIMIRKINEKLDDEDKEAFKTFCKDELPSLAFMSEEELSKNLEDAVKENKEAKEMLDKLKELDDLIEEIKKVVEL